MMARILIVEDEQIVQLDLQHRLQRLGHAVVGAATSGSEAIAKAAELKPDLVLMDVRLEGAMDGIEAASQICAARETPVLLLTAHPSDVERPQSRVLPRVLKPFRIAELKAAIEKALTPGRADNPVPGTGAGSR